MVKIGETRHKEPLNLNRRAAESDLLIYVNINFVPMDGGHKSVAVGLCDYESLRAHHDPQTIRDSDSYMDPARSELNHKIMPLGKLVDEHLNVFHIETALNNRMYGRMDFLLKNEDDFTAFRSHEVRSDALHDGQAAAPGPAQNAALAPGPLRDDRLSCRQDRTGP